MRLGGPFRTGLRRGSVGRGLGEAPGHCVTSRPWPLRQPREPQRVELVTSEWWICTPSTQVILGAGWASWGQNVGIRFFSVTGYVTSALVHTSFVLGLQSYSLFQYHCCLKYSLAIFRRYGNSKWRTQQDESEAFSFVYICRVPKFDRVRASCCAASILQSPICVDVKNRLCKLGVNYWNLVIRVFF